MKIAAFCKSSPHMFIITVNHIIGTKSCMRSFILHDGPPGIHLEDHCRDCENLGLKHVVTKITSISAVLFLPYSVSTSIGSFFY